VSAQTLSAKERLALANKLAAEHLRESNGRLESSRYVRTIPAFRAPTANTLVGRYSFVAERKGK